MECNWRNNSIGETTVLITFFIGCLPIYFLSALFLLHFLFSNLSLICSFPTLLLPVYRIFILTLSSSIHSLQSRKLPVKRSNPEWVSCIRTQVSLMTGKAEDNAGCQTEPTRIMKPLIKTFPPFLCNKSGLTQEAITVGRKKETVLISDYIIYFPHQATSQR